MQPWNTYNGYWHGNAYGPYSAGNQPTQTYDYNHKATTSSSAASVTPPPPGVDSKDGVPVATPTTDSPWSSYGMGFTQAVTNSYAYPPNSAAYPQPYMYGLSSQNTDSPGASAFPAYGSGLVNSASSNQAAISWNAANYGYYPYGTMPGVYAQPWGYPVPPVRPAVIPTVAQFSSNNGLESKSTSAEPVKDAISTGESEATSTAELQQPPSTFQAKGVKEQWSQELKDYVQRAFCSIDTKEEKDQMERILKEKLEYIFRNNIKVDWTTENIPTVPSKAIAALQKSAAPRPSRFNVVRPVQLPGPRGAYVTGPARGSSVRLPVGLIPRGGRNIFSASSATFTAKKIPPAPKRSSPASRSPVSPHRHPWTRRRTRVVSGSRSRSRSSSSHQSSSSSGGRSRPRRRRRLTSRSRSRSSPRGASQPHSSSARNGSLERSPTPVVFYGRSNRRWKRGGGRETLDVSNDPKLSFVKEDITYSRGGRGRGRGGKRGRGANNLANASRLSSRADRFKDHLVGSTLIGSGSIARTTSQMLLGLADERDELSVEFDACQIVGTMQELEKPYLRLTRAPEAHEVRPLSVLKQSLEHVKQKWIEKADYHWACEQFKSIRQDLTVQGIEDEFAVSVYEAHADAALDAGDFEEFHQCQSQLLRLYKEGMASTRFLEFTAYRLLYYIFTLDLLGINTIMAGLRPTHKSNPCIRFALNVRSAWSLHNYRRFSRYVCPSADAIEQPPLRCSRVIHWFLDRERRDSLKIIFKVFRPHINMQFVADALGFQSIDECKTFMCKEFSISTDLLQPEDKVDCKTIWSAICEVT
ncbi:hypothetical protein EG68_10835 [Paragonimus skrjabini miyazakii]|uniref:SAC3/GANP/THP3 conserved domain-containing protein n=1 Tax=Paragonimus skrjabini miyazakii TaxID=59628 RepID=A0A8S9YAC0_9TREM|nr:hypothetical protein EG68_10835 [Paragonimus skrjabini miyazakii]